MSEGQFTKKHYAFLVIWGLSLAFALYSHSFWLGLLLMALFFVISMLKVLKSMIIAAIVAAVLTVILEMIFPPTAIIFTVIFVIMLLFRAKFLIQNWRALAAGFYAYCVYMFVVFANSILFKASGLGIAMIIGGIISADAAQYGSFMSLIVACLIALFMTRGLSRKLKWLYSHGYSTDKALLIMGITPMIFLAIVLPFLKIKINGHEIFDGSLSDEFDVDVDTNANITSSILPSELTSALKYADIDLNDMIISHSAGHVASFSHAIEASVAASAAAAIFGAASEENRSVRSQDGTVQRINYIDETNAVIEEESGRRIGYITLDRENDCEHVRLADGFKYTIEHATGNIIDEEGKLIGKLKDGGNGTKLLVGKNDEVIREFQTDGSIISVTT